MNEHTFRRIKLTDEAALVDEAGTIKEGDTIRITGAGVDVVVRVDAIDERGQLTVSEVAER